MSFSSTEILRLKSSDGVIFNVEEAAATKFGFIKNMVEDGCCSDNMVIPLENVNSKILSMMIEWCKKHTSDDYCNRKHKLKAWDEEFVKDMDQAILYNLLMAADYMNAVELVELVTTKVANMIKGRTVEEIREIFHIKTDLAPEIEKEIRKKNAWVFE